MRQRKQGCPMSASAIKLGALYKEHLPIKTAKYSDLQKLMTYLPPINHEFYNTLKHTSSKNKQNENDAAEDDYLTDYDSE